MQSGRYLAIRNSNPGKSISAKNFFYKQSPKFLTIPLPSQSNNLASPDFKPWGPPRLHAINLIFFAHLPVEVNCVPWYFFPQVVFVFLGYHHFSFWQRSCCHVLSLRCNPLQQQIPKPVAATESIPLQQQISKPVAATEFIPLQQQIFKPVAATDHLPVAATDHLSVAATQFKPVAATDPQPLPLPSAAYPAVTNHSSLEQPLLPSPRLHRTVGKVHRRAF